VKEAIFVKKENPSLNRNGGLRFNLPKIYNNILVPWAGEKKGQSDANEAIRADEGHSASGQ